VASLARQNLDTGDPEQRTEETEPVAHFVEHDMDVLVADVVEEIIWAALLAPVVPIASKLTSQLFIQPGTHIVAAVLATRTLAHISIEKDSPITARIAFRHTSTIGRRVDVKTGSVALKQLLLLTAYPTTLTSSLVSGKPSKPTKTSNHFYSERWSALAVDARAVAVLFPEWFQRTQ
jgi:hypothetical protein